jgi:acyl-CoA thioester hydrolase
MTETANFGLEPCFWGSVNTWECDENDHQNVRFFAHKINQGLQAWIAGVTRDSAMTRAVLPTIRSQHIRFLREARAATPVRVECGQVAFRGRILTAVAVMRHNATGEPLAAFQVEIDTRHWITPWPDIPSVTSPEWARPRGIDPATLSRPPGSASDAIAAGYQIVGRGVIGYDECSPDGTALPHVYIGRVSDGMPNLWVFVNSGAEQVARDEGAMGGAALEYHLDIHDPLRAGDVYTHLSGVRAVAAKTQTMAHLVISERTGRIAASAAAIGVAMDLQTRKAVAISPERRARLERLLLRG